MEYGYNVLSASPLEKSDEGWANGKIWALKKGDLNFDSLGKGYPSDIEVNSSLSCSSDLKTEVITDEQEYVNSMKDSVSFGAGGSAKGFSASFQISDSFEKTSKSFSNGETGMSLATADCKVYEAYL